MNCSAPLARLLLPFIWVMGLGTGAVAPTAPPGMGGLAWELGWLWEALGVPGVHDPTLLGLAGGHWGGDARAAVCTVHPLLTKRQEGRRTELLPAAVSLQPAVPAAVVGLSPGDLGVAGMGWELQEGRLQQELRQEAASAQGLQRGALTSSSGGTAESVWSFSMSPRWVCGERLTSASHVYISVGVGCRLRPTHC